VGAENRKMKFIKTLPNTPMAMDIVPTNLRHRMRQNDRK